MCGLFGIVDLKNATLGNETLQAARAARDVLSHRGPDQHGEEISGNVYLGHRRLSILDLSETGRQPMTSDDSQVSITANGEIYNFQALRLELERAGFKFKSQSDSEVILHGYRYWGAEELAQRMDGMYVAIIHDRKTGTISIIRDRAGIKPLYYFYDGKTFCWASELKAIVRFVGKSNLKIDNEALFDFLTYRYIPAPKTFYKNTFKLPQANVLTLHVAKANISIKPYWALPIGTHTESFDVLAEELRALLTTSVQQQMISDVPVGFLLSGGIDSSIITRLGAPLSNKPQAFSIGFNDPARDESPYAKIVADLIPGLEHHIHMLDEAEMDDLPARMAAWFDEPFGDTSAIPTHRVCAFARERVTVALSGDGGDELFGGYRWYSSYHKLRKLQRFIPANTSQSDLPAWLPQRRRLTMLGTRDPIALYALLRGGLQGAKLEQWRKKLEVPADYDRLWAYRAHYRADLPARKAAQVMDFHTYLPDDIMTKVDRVSMALSLECRPPFLSQTVIEFAYSLPESFIYKNGTLKGGLKSAFADLLPDSIINRGKQGFSVPDSGWRSAMTRKSGSLQEGFLSYMMEKARS